MIVSMHQQRSMEGSKPHSPLFSSGHHACMSPQYCALIASKMAFVVPRISSALHSLLLLLVHTYMPGILHLFDQGFHGLALLASCAFGEEPLHERQPRISDHLSSIFQGGMHTLQALYEWGSGWIMRMRDIHQWSWKLHCLGGDDQLSLRASYHMCTQRLRQTLADDSSHGQNRVCHIKNDSDPNCADATTHSLIAHFTFL